MDTVAMLDPLNADEALRAVPQMNAARDIAALRRTLERLIPQEAFLRSMPLEACMAAMRDLGLVAGSLKRHGVEPVDVVPRLEGALLDLGSRSDMAPRDTVYHYGPCNPRGSRQRTYTGDALEGVLIESVRAAAPALSRAASALEITSERSPADEQFSEGCAQAGSELDVLVHAIDDVRRKLPPHFFARVLRPYFGELTVGGFRYAGPAAAHLPLHIVDHLLWTSDRPDAEYAAFQDEAIGHAPPGLRALFRRQAGRPSLATSVIRALEAQGRPPARAVRASAEALEQLFRRLIAFRGKHLVLARREYKESIRLYAVGSAGASVDLVQRILELTRASSMLLRAGRGGAHASAQIRGRPWGAPGDERPRGGP